MKPADKSKVRLIICLIAIYFHPQQASKKLTLARKLYFNVSSVAFTSSLVTKATVQGQDKCNLLCFDSAQCASILYNKATLECYVFSDLLNDLPLIYQGITEKAYFTEGSTRCTNYFGYTYEATIPLCYKVHQDQSSYEQSQKNCEAEGGRLIQIDSSKKQEAVRIFNLNVNPEKYRIEGRYINNEWILPSGSVISEFYWMPDQNSFSERPCLSINSRHNAKWDDVLCTHPWGYICERVID